MSQMPKRVGEEGLAATGKGVWGSWISTPVAEGGVTLEAWGGQQPDTGSTGRDLQVVSGHWTSQVRGRVHAGGEPPQALISPAESDSWTTNFGRRRWSFPLCWGPSGSRSGLGLTLPVPSATVCGTRLTTSLTCLSPTTWHHPGHLLALHRVFWQARHMQSLQMSAHFLK
jgi:hypothetical protein